MSKQDNLHDFLVDIADAVREKKGTTEPINAQNLSEEIRSIEGGGATEVEMKDVNFYDYDGTRLYSYSWEEAMAMTELPPLPTQKGLICQEWNYTLEDIKEQNGACDVGATYITNDGKTRLYLTIDNERAKDMQLNLYSTSSDNLVVDWGDGYVENAAGKSYITLYHDYSEYGKYVISIEALVGMWEFRFVGAASNALGALLAPSIDRINSLKKIELGERIYSLWNYAFQNCSSLQSIVIPNSVTSIGSNTFQNCSSLQSIVIPNSVTSIGGNIIPNCSSLQSIVIPNSVTSIEKNTFQDCSSLQSIVIPNSVTSIGINTFMDCSSLQSIVIPNSVTSIGNSAIHTCHSLQSIVIPNSVTSLGTYSIYALFSIAYIDFSSHTSIPTLSASNSIGNLNSGTKIIVPDDLYDEWIVATNWTGLVNKIVKDSEYTRPL